MKELIKKLLRESLINETNPTDKLSDLNQWFEEEKEKLKLIKNNKLWHLKHKSLYKEYNRLMNDLSKKYGDDLYGLAGDINATYVYHFTTGDYFLQIMEDNYLMTGDYGISFTTNANLYKSKFVFYHASEHYEGKNWKNVGIRMKFNFNLMKSDGLKFKKGNENVGTHFGEYEILLRQDELENVSKYLIEVAVFRDKEKKYEDIINFLKERNIKHIII